MTTIRGRGWRIDVCRCLECGRAVRSAEAGERPEGPCGHNDAGWVTLDLRRLSAADRAHFRAIRAD